MTLLSFQMKRFHSFWIAWPKGESFRRPQIAAVAIEEFIEREEWQLSEIELPFAKPTKATSPPMRMSLQSCQNILAALLENEPCIKWIRRALARLDHIERYIAVTIKVPQRGSSSVSNPSWRRCRIIRCRKSHASREQGKWCSATFPILSHVALEKTKSKCQPSCISQRWRRASEAGSEQSLDITLVVQENPLRRRRFRQARHGHDLAGDGDDEAGARRKPHLAHGDDVAFRRAAQVRVGGEGILRLRHADRQLAVALLLPGRAAGRAPPCRPPPRRRGRSSRRRSRSSRTAADRRRRAARTSPARIRPAPPPCAPAPRCRPSLRPSAGRGSPRRRAARRIP